MPKEPFKIVSDAINQNVDVFPANQAEDVIFFLLLDGLYIFFLQYTTVE